MPNDRLPIALITGGAGGLGRATAHALQGEGFRIALLGRAAEALAAAGRELGAETFPLRADVADREEVEAGVARLRETWGPPTVLVHAAGIAEASPLLPPDDDLWDRTMATNVGGAWVVATACLPGMLEAGGGTIVNVASTAAVRGYRYVAAYVASKHAVLGLTRAMAVELAPKRVRVNAVCPGFLDTPMTDATVARAARATGRPEAEVRAEIAAMNDRGCLIPPGEVAGEILALVRDGARTGEAVVVE